ncbi:MAG TPA: quinolinate synthase NadA [Steroidobacteraceae bacterium]|nr:quinolinate synthase NadA [Steroidobacteraceae bacterium]
MDRNADGGGRLAEIARRLAPVLPRPEIELSLPQIERITALKAARDAVVVAHNYQIPQITAGVADFVGDSLAMARFAARSHAPVVVVCGVHFMAETVKLLCPDKTVLLPNLGAGCSLAASVTPEDIHELRRRHPYSPVVAYVNTSAAVKAEADVCCTSANAVAVARSLHSAHLIMVPDRHLAEYVARITGLEITSSGGQCEVHVKYAGTDIEQYRELTGAVVLAHPECPRDVQDRADFVGSTGAMDEYIEKRRPKRVLLLTECSMADNVMLRHPRIEFLKPCNLCGFMKTITLEGIERNLEDPSHPIELDPQVAARARRPVERMLAL